MEKETKLLIAAVGLSGIGFFSLLYAGLIWEALFCALLFGAIFLGRMVSLSRSYFDSKMTYRGVYGLVVLVVFFHALSFAHDYSLRDYQKDLLLEIRKTIEVGVLRSDVQNKLTYTLSQYHEKDRESLIGTFKELFPDRVSEDGTYISDFELQERNEKDPESDQYKYFLELNEEKDEITFIGVSEITKGKDPAFKNYDEQMGMSELKLRLNEGGVEYEVVN